MIRKVIFSPEALGFERRTQIAFHVAPEAVVVDRIFHGGQSTDAAFDD